MPSLSPLLPPDVEFPSSPAATVKSALSLDSWYSSCGGGEGGRPQSGLVACCWHMWLGNRQGRDKSLGKSSRLPGHLSKLWLCFLE